MAATDTAEEFQGTQSLSFEDSDQKSYKDDADNETARGWNTDPELKGLTLERCIPINNDEALDANYLVIKFAMINTVMKG